MAKIYKGIPYTGTLPAVLAGTEAGYLHRYKIYGNTDQTGVPTPENPVESAECGERTGQLFDYENSNYQNGRYKMDNGAVNYYTGAGYYAEYIPVEPNSNYFLSNVIGSQELTLRVYFYDINKNWISRSSGHLSDFLITTPSNCKYIQLQISESLQSSTNYMLNLGSTALPYEPYGYKLPLLSGSTPVDIYLGDSQTTRRIRKLVVTGGESWVKSSSRTGSFYLNIGTNVIATLGLCDRAINVGTIEQYDSIGKMFIEPSELQRVLLNVWLFDTNLSLNDFKTYLQQQYTNGTPVTIWYVLATEETGTLNEPLRKIGDYADTIDSTQTTTQIPTSANSTTISWAGEGLAPSLFESIREWVDIMPKIYTSGEWVDAPTYTYTNGEWVADTQ